MKRQYTFSLFVAMFLILAGAVIAGSGKSGNASMAPAIGATVEDFTLPDTDGKSHSLSSLKGKNGAVVIFISVQCPISNAYNERMAKLAEDYGARGISVIGINSNKSESADVVKAHAAEKHLTFTILKDPGNKIADLLGAQHTPEAYYLDTNNKLLYHGRIDNSTDTAKVESNDLRDALDSALAGKPIQKTTSLAFGCSIKRV
ncbi:MAG TPA: thioredoxin family protein [Pyrinomonadaceae bacterium]|nr:thioredoxin family protein [Pyrinomonadaceae bacterium]